MFDNPKKELERLQEQLLAAEGTDTEVFSDEIYEEIDLDDTYTFSHRSAGFDIPDNSYEMNSDRYVPAPKKKGIGGLLFIILAVILLVFALFARWQGWLG